MRLIPSLPLLSILRTWMQGTQEDGVLECEEPDRDNISHTTGLHCAHLLVLHDSSVSSCTVPGTSWLLRRLREPVVAPPTVAVHNSLFLLLGSRKNMSLVHQRQHARRLFLATRT